MLRKRTLRTPLYRVRTTLTRGTARMPDLVTPSTAKDKDNTGIAINWLVVLCEQLVDKVNELTAREEEVKKVQTEAKAMEERLEQKVEEKVESDVTMVTKVIKEKTGVEFLPEEVAACHPLGRATKEPTTWIIRVQNREPNSNFDILSAGMKTGRHPTLNTSFTGANVYLNHQITPKRSKFLKDVVKVAHRGFKIGKYMVDERGNIRVKKEKGARRTRATGSATTQSPTRRSWRRSSTVSLIISTTNKPTQIRTSARSV